MGGEAWGPGNVLPRVGNFSPPCAKTDRALVCAATFGAQTIQFDCALFDYPRVRAHTTAAFTTTRREVIGTRIHEQSVNDRPTSSPRTKVPTYFHSYDDWQPAALRKRVTLKLKLVCTSAKMRAQATRIKSTDDRGPEWSPALSTRHPLLGQQVSPRTTVPDDLRCHGHTAVPTRQAHRSKHGAAATTSASAASLHTFPHRRGAAVGCVRSREPEPLHRSVYSAVWAPARGTYFDT